ncbi:VanY-A/VanY-F/VanY-M family D-Ala-D-Ala carboxypeptidase [Neobacillus sp. MM2021_6]|uniref:VanY-A/VanY-F/VanY-M family D-Ala-D-Ala carboxypeptidase n=1 Tax=Bacillaceae TaxID=186817 RepID=UPI001407E590|nr:MULTISPECIES: VanY-A/VanY-F/VanY-M family D-Ala-D-Ala carboxypeptidase [Bacillaceae]MBO0959682.1 VanY-A/VanY-F/VanY-M family D-Ala-D-Ala carboxypeptidase [Neobacillus sp. MM2021_6]NHC19792.1 VanY-A/VanY-F/VanY-M family D-Ala-D-Ala carboxypeptidase [Bacillus sp. MM2020_4]
MKKWFFLIVIGFASIYLYHSLQDEKEINNPNYNERVEKKEMTEDVQKIEVTKEQIHQGTLLLVNNQYPVDQDSIKKDIIDLSRHNELITGYGLLTSDMKLSEEIAHQFSKMTVSAEKDGVHHFLISSGFRDFDEQEELYKQMGSDYALPAGYSEHNLGLSLDVGSSQMKMSHAPEGKWLENNAWKHGFILRYPEGKTDVTGIKYEPWHIRYVGVPHSAIMKEMNFVLEEYLDYLKEKKRISINVNGEDYMIFYYQISQPTTIEIPTNHPYDISGNNIDGVIVTVCLDEEK